MTAIKSVEGNAMRHGGLKLLALFAALGALLAPGGTPRAETVTPCADGLPVEVAGAGRHAPEICRAAGVALDHLRALGLTPRQPLRIVLVEAAILHGGGLAYGQYDGGRDRLELMSPEAIAAQQPPPSQFGYAIDGAMYGGLVAHELAHAVAQQHRRSDKLGSPAQEYLAYAVQLASLPAALRERIVADAGVQGWEEGDTVSNIYLGLNVHRFAVKSYLHLYGHADRERVIEIVLASRGNVTFTAP